MSSIKVSISKLRQIQFLLGLTAAFTRSVREPITVIVVVSIIYFQVVILGEDIALIIVSTLFLYRALNSLMAVQINLQGLYENGGSIEIVESELLIYSQNVTVVQVRSKRPSRTRLGFLTSPFPMKKIQEP